MNLNTLLLVEDDKMLRHLLRETLERQDFLVLEASLGRRSLDILNHQPVDMILLDINLPDGNALYLIQGIREKSNAPIMIISGETLPETRISGFEMGADDFMAKPFHMDELMARIKAHMRRYQGQLSNENKPCAPALRFGKWTFDPRKFQIFDDRGESAHLTAREFQLLEHMVLNAGSVIRRQDLCLAIREDKYIPTPRAIDVKITRIRKKIGDDPVFPMLIKTVRGVGYLFAEKIHADSE